MIVNSNNKKEINVKKITECLEEMSNVNYGGDYYNVKVNKEMLRDVKNLIDMFEEIMPDDFDFNKGGIAHKVTKDAVLIFANK